MTLDAFFDKYPQAWIAIFRQCNRQWCAQLYIVPPGEIEAIEVRPIVEATAKNQQVALGNLAAKLLHWKEPQEDSPQ